MKEEMMPCAWCEMRMVPVKEGFCSKKCYDDNKKANDK